jgi:hypothetical protein
MSLTARSLQMAVIEACRKLAIEPTRCEVEGFGNGEAHLTLEVEHHLAEHEVAMLRGVIDGQTPAGVRMQLTIIAPPEPTRFTVHISIEPVSGELDAVRERFRA